MAVSPRLQQTLRIDTNITYALDPSKFPGLEDPNYGSQPALLIASTEYPDKGQDIIPSPTPEVHSSSEDLLEDILSVLENHQASLPVPQHSVESDDSTYHIPVMQQASRLPFDNTPTPSTLQQEMFNHRMNVTQHKVGQQRVIPGPADINGATLSMVNSKPRVNDSSMSRYAMDMIFNQLIYPDVGRGNGFSLDTLIQSAPCDVRASRFNNAPSFGPTSYATRLNTVANTVSMQARYGKRKRGNDVICDYDATKRIRHDPNVLQRTMMNQAGGYNQRLVIS